jgi:tRNA (cytidine/uridine-2'-O-)-methyltransferase
MQSTSKGSLTPFNVVLIEPEIPQNTGSIGRLCLATGCRLHLVKPMAFEITESRLRRAGLDYWEHLDVVTHESAEDFLKTVPQGAPMVFFSKKAGHTIFEWKFEPGTWLIFGKETMGLPDWMIQRYPTQTVRIPIFDARVRSLNLSQAVAVAVYEAIRQTG